MHSDSETNEASLLSVVMPCFNERDTIREIVSKVLSVPIRLELIIVDDGSMDETREILEEFKCDDRVRILYHERNQGKGGALSTGFAIAKGDVIVIQDADLEYEPAELVDLYEPIRNGSSDVVYGTRFSGDKHQHVQVFWHKAGNRFLTFLTNVIYGSNITDMETCYKMFRREVIEGVTIRSKRFDVESEITSKILRAKKWRVHEVPISYHGRSFEEGKKISWRDGIVAVWALLKYRFTD